MQGHGGALVQHCVGVHFFHVDVAHVMINHCSNTQKSLLTFNLNNTSAPYTLGRFKKMNLQMTKVGFEPTPFRTR